VSPDLWWENVPAKTKTFALICEDPDAPMGTWIHWVFFNLPARVHALEEDASIVVLGGIEGENSWGKNVYGGPCPPDKEHRYFFTLYALDCSLDLSRAATKKDLMQAINADNKKHILDSATLMGTYNRLSNRAESK
jgi:Raf kinase inhibitor-like YbhB/YbcL family protein